MIGKITMKNLHIIQHLHNYVKNNTLYSKFYLFVNMYMYLYSINLFRLPVYKNYLSRQPLIIQYLPLTVFIQF